MKYEYFKAVTISAIGFIPIGTSIGYYIGANVPANSFNEHLFNVTCCSVFGGGCGVAAAWMHPMFVIILPASISYQFIKKNKKQIY